MEEAFSLGLIGKKKGAACTAPFEP